MSLEGKRVLIVEDDALLLMSLQDMMSDFGCAVAGCAMALDPALQMARDLPIDIAVLDVNLAGELVTPVAELLAAKGVPFVFATGYDSHIVPSLADRPRVAKPYTGKQLEAALRRALAT
jgi:DNA-binding response OmpR family regulator